MPLNKRTANAIKQLFFVLKNSVLLLFFCLLPSMVWADDIFKQTVKSDKSSVVDTIWIVGDPKQIETALTACAMIFNTSSWQGAFFFAVLLAIMGMALNTVIKRNMQAFDYIIFIVLSSCLFLPKTTVHVASYYQYDASTGTPRGNADGAIETIDVGNIPIGVAWTLGITSNMMKEFTQWFDQGMQNVNQDTSFLIQGAEGYFSPLKTTLRLREAWDVPEITHNLYHIKSKCNPQGVNEALNEKGGIRAALDVPSTAKGQSISGSTVPFKFAGDIKKNIAPEELEVECPLAMTLVYHQMLAQVVDTDGKGYSKVAERLAKARSLSNSVLSGTGGDGREFTQRAKTTQTEMDALANKVLSSLGSSNAAGNKASNPQLLLDGVKNYLKANPNKLNTKATVLQSMQGYLMADSINAAEIQANIMFANLVANCLGSNDKVCLRSNNLMTNAISRASIDSAGEAGMFQHFIHHSMNILAFVYIVMSPIMMILIVAMGIRGWKLIGSYLLLAVWINSWLPLSIAITNYMLNGYESTLDNLIYSLTSNAGDPKQILSPVVMNNILNSASDMIASASSMLSMVPMIMFAFLTGSAYGLVHIAQRAGMTDKGYVDESKVATDLANHEAVNAMQMLSRNAMATSTATMSGNSPIMSLAELDNPTAMSFGTTSSLQAAHSVGEHSQTMAGENISTGVEHSLTGSDATTADKTTMSADGKIITTNVSDGTTGSDQYKHGELQQDGVSNTISKQASWNAGVSGGANVGGGGAGGAGASDGGAGGAGASDGGAGGSVGGRRGLAVSGGVGGGGTGIYTTSKSNTHSGGRDTTYSATASTQHSGTDMHSTGDVATVKDSFGTNTTDSVSQSTTQSTGHTNSQDYGRQTTASAVQQMGVASQLSFTAFNQGLNDANPVAVQQGFANAKTVLDNELGEGNGYSQRLEEATSPSEVYATLQRGLHSSNIHEQIAAKNALGAIYATPNAASSVGENYASLADSNTLESMNTLNKEVDTANDIRPINAKANADPNAFENTINVSDEEAKIEKQQGGIINDYRTSIGKDHSLTHQQYLEQKERSQTLQNTAEIATEATIPGVYPGINGMPEGYFDKKHHSGEYASESALKKGMFEKLDQLREQDKQSGLQHTVYNGSSNDGINLMTDSGERIPVDNTPHNEPQNSAMPVAQQGTQINQAEVKQADIQQAEVPHSEKVADTVADNAAQNATNEQSEQTKVAEETPSQTADDKKSLLEKAGEVAESAIKGVLGISEAHAADTPIMHRQPENQQDSGIVKTGYQGQGETPFSDNQNADTPYQLTQQTDRWAFVGNVGSAENMQSPQSNEPKPVADKEEQRLTQQKAEEEQRKAEEERRLAEQKAAQEEQQRLQKEQEEKARLEREKAEEEQRKAEEDNKKKSLINHETKKGVSLKSADYEINNLYDKNEKVSFNGFGKGIEKSIDEASKKYNVPKDYLYGLLRKELGWYGEISDTGCAGPGQFSKGTWNLLARTPAGKEIGMTLVTKENAETSNDPRYNPHINIMATGLLTKLNREELARAKIPTTYENLYMIHNIGSPVKPALKGSDKVSAAAIQSMKDNGMTNKQTPTQWVEQQKKSYTHYYNEMNNGYYKDKQ